jgi:hypothetical protein
VALVVIQAGHCHRSTGATGTNGLDGDPNEQEFAWAAANRSAALLRVAGHRTRVILADVPSSQYQGDVFCAIHCDGSTSRTARGASVGYRNDSGKRLASAWKQAYYDLGWRGFRADNYTAALAGYYGVRNAVNQGNRFAFIAEAGFLTSPDDERLLSGSAGTERFARALTNAVVSIFGGHSTPPQEDDMNLDETIAAMNDGQPLAERHQRQADQAAGKAIARQASEDSSALRKALREISGQEAVTAVDNVLKMHSADTNSPLRNAVKAEVAEALTPVTAALDALREAVEDLSS